MSLRNGETTNNTQHLLLEPSFCETRIIFDVHYICLLGVRVEERLGVLY
jgi:hypothetical protein